METRYLGFDHTRIAVHVHGNGPLALLLHGYPLDHRMWLQTLHGPLAEQRTLVAIDLRGHGHSPHCGDAEHSMAMFADDVARRAGPMGKWPRADPSGAGPQLKSPSPATHPRNARRSRTCKQR